MTPVIGLSTYREDARWGVWHTAADLLHAGYADSVAAAGGVPVLLPPADGHDDPVDDLAAAVVARLDGLVVTGGADVDPARYDARAHPETGGLRPDRDRWELALLRAADARGLPVLGVCRGMQLLAVAAGGALVQHLPDVVGSARHSPGADAFGDVPVRTAAGSRVAAAVGEQLTARCHHHQSVAGHPGLLATAHAADGTVEALERPGEQFWVGVQWHPESERDARVFRALVTAASGSADRARTGSADRARTGAADRARTGAAGS